MSAGTSLRFADMGEAALLAEIMGCPEGQAAQIAISLDKQLHAGALPAGVIETIPGLGSLLILYEPAELSRAGLIARIEYCHLALTHRQSIVRQRHTVPVLYGGEDALDLAATAELLGLSPAQLIEAHAASRYTVYMLGFLPGFPYMGDLPEALRAPRREVPHVRVPKGAVAIAGALTGIYPLESPGGWRVIGITPIELWNVRRSPRPLIEAGDEVTFNPVSEAEFRALAEQGRFAG
jgi:KipI family sensor histidine kinase inhibitor